MDYKIQIEQTAVDDAVEYIDYIKSKSNYPDNAYRWRDDLYTTIASLGDNPKRFPIIPENSEHPIELRHVVFHSHRIIYHVDEEKETVHVLRIFHAKLGHLEM